ncbi:Hypothetical predicted protein [Cloeon dipterum]|uniref:Uncharacterized protein n=1 Tax=Cloeon dipterum TaxID=197152 RepID=A0A8S1CW48_9INSE|nr:Hypothetical predicted protein [Cloeon dipterum]
MTKGSATIATVLLLVCNLQLARLQGLIPERSPLSINDFVAPTAMGTEEVASTTAYYYVVKLYKISGIEKSTPAFVLSSRWALTGTYNISESDEAADYGILAKNGTGTMLVPVSRITFLDFGLALIKTCETFKQNSMPMTPTLMNDFSNAQSGYIVYYKGDVLYRRSVSIPSNCECERDDYLYLEHDIDTEFEACLAFDASFGACSLITDSSSTPTYVRSNALLVDGIGVAFLDHDHCDESYEEFLASPTYIKIEPYYPDIVGTADVTIP